MPEPHELAAALTQDIVDAIGKTLTDAMNGAINNGADSRSMPDEYVATAAWLSGIPPKTKPVEETRKILLKVAGKPFRCSCGCNVFHQTDTTNPNEYTCNGCDATYEGD